MAKGRFLAEIDVCTERRIVRTITIESRKMAPEQARRKALAEFAKMKGHGRYIVLQELEAFCSYGRITVSHTPTRPLREVVAHERFHGTASSRKASSCALPLEESASYAYESTAAPRNVREEMVAAKQMRTYRRLARHSVRFLFALTMANPNGLLQSSMTAIRRDSTAIAGDSMAIGFNYAKDFMLYSECQAIVKRWGAQDSRKIFMEALEIANESGLNEARRFLLRHLPQDRKNKIEEDYGIDLRGFRFSSPYATNFVCEDWVW